MKVGHPRVSWVIDPQLTDLTDARRYFKQSEIVLYRQAPEGLTLAQEQNKLIAAS
jgi:hypothetical protein